MKAQHLCLAVAVAFLTAAAPARTLACGFHGVLPDLAAAHPRSIDVALAVRDAFDTGWLEPLESSPAALGYMRVARLLQQARPVLGPLATAGHGSGTVLLVESGLWTRYARDGNSFLAQPHIDGPTEREPVIVTSEAVLRSLVDGTLTPAMAMELGVLVVVTGQANND